MSIEIFGVQFDGEESVVISYMNVPEDVRVQGLVGLQHQCRLDLAHPDYAEDADLLRRHAQRMLSNALDDFNDSEPWDGEEPDPDDDDERGMGDG